MKDKRTTCLILLLLVPLCAWLLTQPAQATKYFTPEVFLTGLHLEVHEGLGCFRGESVSQPVVLEIWTNKPQTVELLLALYDADEGKWVSNKTVTLSLREGVNEVLEWVNVNDCSGGRFWAYAEIIRWEHDTDPRNNRLRSEELFLKPFVDIQVFILYKAVKQKQSWTILPGDRIEIDIGVKIPINTTHIPAKLSWRVEALNLKSLRYEAIRENAEELRVEKPGIVWRNITLEVPWTSKIRVLANATHEWEAVGLNNYADVTLEIDPDVKIEIIEKPTEVTEGDVFRLVLKIESNVEPGGGSGWISVYNKATNTLLKKVDITLEPEKIIELEVKAPKNPNPSQVHHPLVVRFAGYDMYKANNRQEFTLIVKSAYTPPPQTALIDYQLLWTLMVIAVIAIAIALIAVALAIKAMRSRI